MHDEQPMNLWLWSAAAILVPLASCMIVSFRGRVPDRVCGLMMSGLLVTMELLCLCEGFNRSSFYDLPLALAFLMLGSGLLFARFVQRWL